MLSVMEVDLLTNALLPNVEAPSGRGEPVAAKPVGGNPTDSPVGIQKGEALEGENNEVTDSGNPAKGKPSKDFAETLEEKMQVEAPEAAENAESIVDPGVVNVPSPAQSEAISSEPQGHSAKTGSVVSTGAFTDARERAGSEEQAGTLPESSENSGKDVFGSEEGGSIEPGGQKLDPGHIQSVVSKSNGTETLAPQADNAPEFEQAVPAEAPQVSLPEQPLAVQHPNSPPSPLPGDNAAVVSEQIRESITSSTIGPGREITIRLNPPELGTVVVKFQEQDNQITGLLEVSELQTRAEIQQVLPEITRDLQDFGVQIRRIEVVMAPEGESETPGGQSAMPQDDRWAGQEGPQGFESNAMAASVGGVFSGNTAYAGSDAYSRSYVTDKAIDVFA
ncbi:MAG: flagellar hook-length control protein FliK [Planctomycetota bacterium]|jgi:flagellar hook-length control protein FliK